MFERSSEAERVEGASSNAILKDSRVSTSWLLHTPFSHESTDEAQKGGGDGVKKGEAGQTGGEYA